MKFIFLFLVFSQVVFSQSLFNQNEQTSFIKEKKINGLRNLSEEKKRNFLNQFIGKWKGEGKIAGLSSKIVMTWENALGGKFVKLTFRNEMQRRDGKTQLFEGNAFYKNTSEQKIEGHWFDSGGEYHPINAKFENGTLNSLWGIEGKKLGRTIYRLVEKDKMEVIDSIKLKNGTWREFGRSVYVRQ